MQHGDQCASSYSLVSFEQMASTRVSLTLASLLFARILGPYKASTHGTKVKTAPCIQLVEVLLENDLNLQVLQVNLMPRDIQDC
jgi:hypothetical protein